MKHQVPDSMKFKKLMRRLGVSRVVAVGTLELLWTGAQKNAPRGDVGRFSDEEIAIECGWEGEPETLVNALVESGWLDRCEENRLVIHDWEHHAPGWIKRQLSRSKQSFVTVKNGKTVPRDGLETTRNLTQPNPKKSNPKQPNPTAASAASAEPEKPAAAQEPADLPPFPVVGGDGQWMMPQALLDSLSETFASLDVRGEVSKARAWLECNPTRRKTPRGMAKFLFGWLERSQNRNGGKATATSDPRGNIALMNRLLEEIKNE
jgi:hypothetical protein